MAVKATPKAKPKKVPTPRDRGTPFQIAWTRTKEAAERGEIWRAISNISIFSSGVAGGLMLHQNPKVQATGQALAAMSVPVAIASGLKYQSKRTAYRESPRNLENLKRVAKTKDSEWLRQLDYSFVEKYSIDPKDAEKRLEVSTIGAATKFATLRMLRKAPDAQYSISAHETRGFSSIAKPILQYYSGRLPPTINREALLYQHFPEERLDTIADKKLIPENLRNRIPPRLLEASPQSAEEATALAMLAGSIARWNLVKERQK